MKQPHKCRYRQGCLCILIFMENVDTTKLWKRSVNMAQKNWLVW